MKLLKFVFLGLMFLALNFALLALQRRESDDRELLPTNSQEKAEWVFARYHYDSAAGFGGFGGYRRWAADYPRSDRQFVLGVRRLTRLDTRPIEQVVEANSEDIYDWPWIFVEDAGSWRITPPQAQRLRDYLLKGGFLVLDDSHGDFEWQTLIEGVNMILPGRPIEDLPDGDEIFHVLYDLNANDRFQVPGTRFLWGGRTYSADMQVPKWRGIRDDQGRIMVAIWHNSDVGDAWEWADSPRYPERATSLAYRLGINYIIYGMTH